MTYPVSSPSSQVDVLHGVTVADPYRWLENAKSPAVSDWVTAQNAFTRSVLDRVPGCAAIHARLGKLLEIGTIGTPSVANGRYSYTRRDGTQNQPVLFVREGLQGAERILLDLNRLRKDGTLSLDWYFPSRDGSLLAYGISENGNEESLLHVLDVISGKNLPDVITRARACSVAWQPDSKGFYYTRYPAVGSVPKGEEQYHRHVFFHELGADPETDRLVFGTGRPLEDWPDVMLAPGGRWLVVTEHQGWAKSEVFIRDLSDPSSTFRPLVEKVNAIFEATVRDDRVYLRTNENAPRYKLLAIDPLKPSREDWAEIIPEGPDVLDGIAAIGEWLITLRMHQASSRLAVHDRLGIPVKEVSLPTLGTIAGLGGEWNGTEVFYGFQSFTVAPSIFRVDLVSRKSELWKKIETDLDPNRYEIEQVFYPSKDGTKISMFLVHKRGLTHNGLNPTVLWAYGGFNISITPTFSASRFLFLEQGGVIAIPNLRGGGEYGEGWHEAGMLGKKQNVFDDFIAAAEFLIQERLTSPKYLVIEGRSNGGLLVGAALTQRPELFRAVVCGVPLLDMVRYHKFLIARLWIPEYGSPDEEPAFKWLYAYSPYHRVQDGTAYPAVLFEAAESDTRVDALHARKMAARLQAATTSPAKERPILLRLETNAGHGVGKPRAKVLEELTDTWSFIFWQLGLTPD